LLRAAEVSYGYGAGARRGGDAFTLAGVSLNVERGGFVGLLGPNGCGKTTLLKLLGGTLAPQAGTVTLDGKPLAGLSRRHIAQQIAIVPQETHPMFDFTVMEMVLMGRHPHLETFAIEGPADVAIAHEALAATGTVHLTERAFMTLSGGEKQRVVIASALAQSPDVLLLDEPTASLDLGYQIEIAALLRRLNRERQVTLVVATHDLNLAASLCDRLVLLKAGRSLAAGATAAVLTPANIRTLYGVDADVAFHTGAGHLTVVPLGAPGS
jgi:iron complex transport system ATP-binding protein